MRRFTRLTNAFSKKLENHMHAVSFYFMVNNFVKIHKTIKTTPAMEAGVTTYLWTMEDIDDDDGHSLKPMVNTGLLQN